MDLFAAKLSSISPLFRKTGVLGSRTFVSEKLVPDEESAEAEKENGR